MTKVYNNVMNPYLGCRGMMFHLMNLSKQRCSKFIVYND